MKKTTALETALYFNSHSLPVFPCRNEDEPKIDNKTGEQEFDPETGELVFLKEKTPYLSNGFYGATKYKRIVERWWKDWPNATIGIPTGKASGFFVLDIDNKHKDANGFKWLDKMIELHGELPETARATTPNGGLHIYFKYVEGVRNRGEMEKGVDLRGEGGLYTWPRFHHGRRTRLRVGNAARRRRTTRHCRCSRLAFGIVAS